MVDDETRRRLAASSAEYASGRPVRLSFTEAWLLIEELDQFSLVIGHHEIRAVRVGVQLGRLPQSLQDACGNTYSNADCLEGHYQFVDCVSQPDPCSNLCSNLGAESCRNMPFGAPRPRTNGLFH
jgi:hypothetical protein